MGEKTDISWTQHTWNPWQGCTKVSPGCAHCYMYRDKKKYGQDPSLIVRSKTPTFNKPLSWHEPALVFTCSWSDFFHEDADEWRNEAWSIIKCTPHLTYQILTKRPERIAAHLPRDWGEWGEGYPNVWLGTSVENQRWAQPRLDALLAVPAVIHFVSCEPLLGPIDLAKYMLPGGHVYEHVGAWRGGFHYDRDALDWVIVGGESGPGYRPMDPQWARDLRDQCTRRGIAFFFKQSAGLRPETGTLLDGREWHQFPEVKVAA